MWRPSRRKPLKKAAEDALLKSAADAKRVYEKTRLMRAAEVEAIVAAAAAAKEEKKKSKRFNCRCRGRGEEKGNRGAHVSP